MFSFNQKITADKHYADTNLTLLAMLTARMVPVSYTTVTEGITKFPLEINKLVFGVESPLKPSINI